MSSNSEKKLSLPDKQDLKAMSVFRYELRKFLRVSEEISNAAGITTLQYQLLLHVRGFPEREWATVGELAELVQAAPNGTGALISRCEASGLVRRKADKTDRRQVQVHLTAKGERCLLQLAAEHKAHYGSFRWVFGAKEE